MKAVTVLFLAIVACWIAENATWEQAVLGGKIVILIGLGLATVGAVWQAVKHD